MKTPPTDVAGFGPPASGSGLPLPADADIAAKKTGGCKTSTVELSDSPTLRRGGNSNQSMGAGLDPLDPAPGHYCHTDPMRPTSPRATPPDAGDLGPPLNGTACLFKAHWDPACDGRRCPGGASGAGVPWHGLLSQNDGPSARPPRHALYGQRLEAPIKKENTGGRPLVAHDDNHGPRVVDYGRSRRPTRSAATGFELRRLVCPAAPPVLPSLA